MVTKEKRQAFFWLRDVGLEEALQQSQDTLINNVRRRLEFSLGYVPFLSMAEGFLSLVLELWISITT